MPLAASDLVINGAEVGVAQPALPLRGLVESTGPTVVDWRDGTRTEYTTSDAQLRKLIALVDPNNNGLVTGRVRLAGAANRGQRSEGVVVSVFALETPGGTNLNDFVVIAFDDGTFGTVGVGAIEVIG